MYAFEKKWYHQLTNKNKIITDIHENEIINQIHTEHWFDTLFLTSIDYSNEYWYPKCPTA